MFIFLKKLDEIFLCLLCGFKPWWPAELCEVAPEQILSNWLSKMLNRKGGNSVRFGGLVDANRIRKIEQRILWRPKFQS